MKRLRTAFSRLFEDIRRTGTALLLLILYSVITQLLFRTVCPFLILFHFPCPACGLTRAGLLLLTGRPAAALAMNAAIFLWIPFLIYLVFFRYFLGKKPPFGMGLCILICLSTLVLYFLRLFRP